MVEPTWDKLRILVELAVISPGLVPVTFMDTGLSSVGALSILFTFICSVRV